MESKPLFQKCIQTLKRALIGMGSVLLAACSLPDEPERLAKQGLPPSDFVASVKEGRVLYERHCADCHGLILNGSTEGPPLVHKYYEPGHHADLSFYRAVKFGVQSHHWNFGDMEPVPNVTPTEVGHVVAYVRERQRQSGIQ